jgi:putative transposase
MFHVPYRSDMKNIINKIGYDYDIEIIELEVPVDHTHMVVRTEPKVTPSQVMQIVKSILASEFSVCTQE